MSSRSETRWRGSVEMTGLRQLHKSMRAASCLRVQFGYRNNGTTEFVVVFLADENPFQLMIAARRGSFGAVLDVRAGYRVEPCVEDIGALLEVLRIRPGKEEFKMTEFLKDVDSQAPETYKACARPEPQYVARMPET